MGKIRGKFAPLFEDLGNDPRWLLELNDFEKLIYHLVLCTIYWSNGTAPDDARYYQRRYNLRARPYQVRRALDAIKQRFRKLVAKDKKLSLLNYVGYESRVAKVSAIEVEREVEVEKEVEYPASPIPKEKKKDENPYKKDLSGIKVGALTEPAKHKAYNHLISVFTNRGWNPNLIMSAFKTVADRVNAAEPKSEYPYFSKALARYVSENAEMLNHAGKREGRLKGIDNGAESVQNIMGGLA